MTYGKVGANVMCCFQRETHSATGKTMLNVANGLAFAVKLAARIDVRLGPRQDPEGQVPAFEGGASSPLLRPDLGVALVAGRVGVVVLDELVEFALIPGLSKCFHG